MADFYNGRVQRFDTSGNFISTFGQSGVGDAILGKALGLGVLSNGDIVVGDLQSDVVKVYSDAGVFRRKFGSAGFGDGQLNDVNGIGVDAADNTYVAEFENLRVQKFSSTGTFSGYVGSIGLGSGHIERPTDVAISAAGKVFVVDRFYNRVEIFGLPFQVSVQKSGTGSGTISSKEGLIRCGTDCLDRYDATTPITLKAKAAPRSYFVKWSGGSCSGAARSCSFTPSADSTLTATFKRFPKLSISSNPSSSTTSRDATFAFSTTTAGFRFQCKLDSAGYRACLSPAIYTNVGAGRHTFSVRASKNGASSAPVIYSWIVQ